MITADAFTITVSGLPAEAVADGDQLRGRRIAVDLGGSVVLSGECTDVDVDADGMLVVTVEPVEVRS